MTFLPVEKVVSELSNGTGEVICMRQWNRTVVSKQALRQMLGPESKEEFSVERRGNANLRDGCFVVEDLRVMEMGKQFSGISSVIQSTVFRLTGGLIQSTAG